MTDKKETFSSRWIKFQADMVPVKKDAYNPAYRSNYASLNAILETITPVLRKHGMSLIQEGIPACQPGWVGVRTTVTHESSDEPNIVSRMELPLNKIDAQTACAAITYCKRCDLQVVFLLETDDDDGETAVGRGSAPAKSRVLDSKPPGPQLIAAPAIVAYMKSNPTVSKEMIVNSIKRRFAPKTRTTELTIEQWTEIKANVMTDQNDKPL